MLIFEQDLNEHIAHALKWEESFLPLLLEKVVTVFRDSTELKIEIWPHYGQLAFWEKGEQVSKHMKGVHLKIDEWFIGWNKIVDSDMHEAELEIKISLYENNLTKFIIPKLKPLEEQFRINYFLTDESKIIF